MLSVSCFYNPFVRAAWRTYVIGSINDHVYNSIPYWNIHWTETPTSLSLSDLEVNAIVHKVNHSLDLLHACESVFNNNYSTHYSIPSYYIHPDGWGA